MRSREEKRQIVRAMLERKGLQNVDDEAIDTYIENLKHSRPKMYLLGFIIAALLLVAAFVLYKGFAH
jgi:hypothetical protein